MPLNIVRLIGGEKVIEMDEVTESRMVKKIRQRHNRLSFLWCLLSHRDAHYWTDKDMKDGTGGHYICVRCGRIDKLGG